MKDKKRKVLHRVIDLHCHGLQPDNITMQGHW